MSKTSYDFEPPQEGIEMLLSTVDCKGEGFPKGKIVSMGTSVFKFLSSQSLRCCSQGHW